MVDDYILITPVKNEEKTLLEVIRSVKNQTKKPILWVIVNDGSTDKSPEIIRNAMENYEWIKTINLLESERDIGLRYSYVCKTGFDYAVKYAREHNIKYQYIGLLDSDIIIEKDYFEKLIEEFKRNPRLGIVSGVIYSYNGRKYVLDIGKKDIPRGANRLWRRECFEETGGYIITYGPDTVSNIKAKLKGWETRRFEEITAKQTRMTSAAEGLKKGYFKNGEAHYYLYQRPTIVFLRSIKYLFSKRFYLSFYYLYGYVNAMIKKIDRIDDEEIIEYYQNRKVMDYIKGRSQ